MTIVNSWGLCGNQLRVFTIVSECCMLAGLALHIVMYGDNVEPMLFLRDDAMKRMSVQQVCFLIARAMFIGGLGTWGIFVIVDTKECAVCTAQLWPLASALVPMVLLLASDIFGFRLNAWIIVLGRAMFTTSLGIWGIFVLMGTKDCFDMNLLWLLASAMLVPMFLMLVRDVLNVRFWIMLTMRALSCKKAEAKGQRCGIHSRCVV